MKGRKCRPLLYFILCSPYYVQTMGLNSAYNHLHRTLCGILENGTDAPACGAQIRDTEGQRMDMCTRRGAGEKGEDRVNWGIRTDIYTLLACETDRQWQAAIYHREFCSVRCRDLEGRDGGEGGRRDVCIHVADSLNCIAETSTTWQNTYMPIKKKNALRDSGNTVEEGRKE